MVSTLGAHNPLRYRGYVYDEETGFYYLQSRYYDPSIGRFINVDALISTDQSLLSSNMFAYCINNPVVYIDPNGYEFIGFGFQFEIQIGDISYGFEVVIYTDAEVCDGEDFVVAVYNYSGYDVSIGDMQQVSNIIETLVTTFVYDTHNEDLEAFYSAATFVFNGAGVSGGAYLLFGNENFDDPSDYSGGFETWSASAKIKGVTVTGFHSFSETCDAYGFKIGAHFDGLRVSNSAPFGFAYSRSYYSQPCILEF